MIAQPQHVPTRSRRLAILTLTLSCVLAALLAHVSFAAAVQGQQSEDQPPQAIEIKTLKQDSGVIKSAQIEALREGRDPMQLIRDMEMLGHRVDGGWVTSQETLASSSKAVIEKNILLADSFNLNLPEGSMLKAVLSGDRVTTSSGTDGKMEITIENGKVELFDQGNVKRVILRAEPQNAKFVLSARMDAGEVAFVASTPNGNTKLRLEFDRTTGVPKDEQQPPHGAVRYELVPPSAPEENRVRLKIQWIYNVDQVREEHERGQKE